MYTTQGRHSHINVNGNYTILVTFDNVLFIYNFYFLPIVVTYEGRIL